MSRPLRIDVQGGWYHITARGIERRAVFHDKTYYRHFLELLEEMSERYGVEVHAYCLMVNHYHLIIRAPNANVSKAMQWLNVSYSAWYNAKRQRVGHLFQGRFGSVLIDGEGSWLLLASVYLHPVRTRSMGLGKKADRAERSGFKEPGREDVKLRLAKLTDFQWSSYSAYAGYSGKPKWLHTESILSRSGGKNQYREYVQKYITRGYDPAEFECLRARVAIGTRAFMEQSKKMVGKITKEQPNWT